jgi:histone deacetylase 1/2
MTDMIIEMMNERAERNGIIERCNRFFMATTNLNPKKAVELYGEKAIDSMVKELKQICVDRKVVTPTMERVTPNDLIPVHMFLKEKSDGQLKARAVAGGNHQDRTKYAFDDIHSPTVSLISVFIVTIIGLKLGFVSAVMDVRGAYLYAKIKEQVFVIFNKILTKIIIEKINPSWKCYVQNERLVCRLEKALYGLVESAKLWKIEADSTLNALGFSVHSMDECVYTKGEGAEMLILLLYVDDIKIFGNEKNIGEFIKEFSKVYEVSIGDREVHTYLGMKFDYSVKGEVVITVPRILDEALEEMKTHMNEKQIEKYPCDENLFEIKEDSDQLDDERKALFHSVVYKLLYVAIRVEIRILLAVNFLTSRVQNPTEEDWMKLLQVMQYIKCTTRSGIKFKPDGESFRLDQYIDVSHASHRPSYRSQTGDVLFLNGCLVQAHTGKQRLNTKSSTESELVGVSDRAGVCIWTKNFLVEMNFVVKSAVIHQDNQASINLIRNGKSFSDRTRHMNIRLFWIKDAVNKKVFDIVHTGTKEMKADVLSKPVIGKLFRIMFDEITGAPIEYRDKDAIYFSLLMNPDDMIMSGSVLKK